MSIKTVTNRPFSWANLDAGEAYNNWRSAKLKAAEIAKNLPPVAVSNLSRPTDSERNELARRCETNNFAVYACGDSCIGPDTGFSTLADFAAAFDLKIAETHRSAEDSGIVALKQTDQGGKRGYIPYSTRAMNWHTDGYYNSPQHRISAFVLHCVHPAQQGGVNQLLDPEILYIRLRDENPDYIHAMMHPAAMTIPENREPDGSLRPASVGPVFFADPETGRMQMRYTARTRSIEWRDDPLTAEAQEALRACLSRGDPLMQQISLSAGQGVLNNNVLHNRTEFENGSDTDHIRLILRVRFHNRIKETRNG